jgi:hypothetical protein
MGIRRIHIGAMDQKQFHDLVATRHCRDVERRRRRPAQFIAAGKPVAIARKRPKSGLSRTPAVLKPNPGRQNLATTGLREIVLTGSRQLVQQGLGVLQIGGVEAFGEPAVDRGEEVAGLSAFALIAPQAGKAGGGAQLPRTRGLPAGDS